MLTAETWTTITTGVAPIKHGIFGFWKDGADGLRRPVTAADRSAEALWSQLSRLGKRVVVVNVPMTYPPDRVNGVMISGMDAPSLESPFTYPEELRKNLLVDYDYQIDIPQTLDLYALLEQLEYITDNRFRVIAKLVKEEKWDFFMFVTICLDRVQHFFWKHMESLDDHGNAEDQHLKNAIFHFYRKVDKIGRAHV